MKELDLKHGFDLSINCDAIPKQEARKKLNELADSRARQDITLKPEKLFDEGRWDNKKFNAAFDIIHQREEGNIVLHDGIPSAWNDHGTIANYSNFDDLDNIYVNEDNRFDTSRQNYSSIVFAESTKKITKDDMDNISGADYVDNHNVIEHDYYQTMKSKLSSRRTDAVHFDKMAYDDFKRDNMAGYGITDQIGFDFSDRLGLDGDHDHDDISKKFDKLMADRQAIPTSNGKKSKSTGTTNTRILSLDSR